MEVLNLRALLTLDKSEYDKSLADAGDSASSFGSKFASGMKTAAKVGAAAFAATATAVAVLGKKAISAYADTEQLVGGVAKLYGNMGMSVEDYAKSVGKSVDQVNSDWKRNEQAQRIVMENAKNAFKTAGVSANEYMESATSFSAALINSLGGDTKKAAQQTDVAMRAIADNYNTFGGDMGQISYAFQGFAKQNYTMLDNLKLGYGGTKTEMERLIADANTWAEENGKAADLSIDSFSDVVTAIDYIQQKQNIAGTTAREASTTIAGSIGMVKSAYDNLMAGFANPDADISQLVSDLVTSVGTAAKNIVPAIQQFVKGFGESLTEISPMIINGIPQLMSTLIPMITTSATQLIGVLIQTISSSLPQLLAVGEQMLKTLSDGIGSNVEGFISNGLNLILKFSETVRKGANRIIPAALSIVQKLAQGIIKSIPTFIKTVPTILSNFAGVVNDNAPKVIEVGISIIKSLVVGIIKAIPVIIENMPKILKAMVDVFMAFNWINLGKVAMSGISKGLSAAGGSIKSAVMKPINSVKSAITSGFKSAKDRAVSYMNALRKGVSDKIGSARDTVKKAINKIKGFFPLKVGKIFSGIKLPHFSVKGKAPFGLGGKGTKPSIGVNWYKKAYDEPYLFTNPTVVSGLGFGDGVGDEMVYGKNALMGDITDAMEKGGGKTTNIYITSNVSGTENPEEYAERLVGKIKLAMRTA